MSRSESGCPFCQPQHDRIIAERDLAIALRDKYPVSRGHLLVCPRRHVESFFELSETEFAAIMRLVQQMKQASDTDFHPDGYNLGVNVGRAAGQTVMHVHVHLIPRYHGDVPDPTGGIRNVIPGRGNYLRFPAQTDTD